MQLSLDAARDKVEKLRKYQSYYKRHIGKKYRNCAVQVSMKDGGSSHKKEQTPMPEAEKSGPK